MGSVGGWLWWLALLLAVLCQSMRVDSPSQGVDGGASRSEGRGAGMESARRLGMHSMRGQGEARGVVAVSALEEWAEGYLRELQRAGGHGRQSKAFAVAERSLAEALRFARGEAAAQAQMEVGHG